MNFLWGLHLFLLPSSSIFSILCPDKSTPPCLNNFSLASLTWFAHCSAVPPVAPTLTQITPDTCLHPIHSACTLSFTVHCFGWLCPHFSWQHSCAVKLFFVFFSSNNTWTEIYLLRQQCSNCLCFSTEQEILPYHQVSSWCTLHWQQ